MFSHKKHKTEHSLTHYSLVAKLKEHPCYKVTRKGSTELTQSDHLNGHNKKALLLEVSIHEWLFGSCI